MVGELSQVCHHQGATARRALGLPAFLPRHRRTLLPALHVPEVHRQLRHRILSLRQRKDPEPRCRQFLQADQPVLARHFFLPEPLRIRPQHPLSRSSPFLPSLGPSPSHRWKRSFPHLQADHPSHFPIQAQRPRLPAARPRSSDPAPMQKPDRLLQMCYGVACFCSFFCVGSFQNLTKYKVHERAALQNGRHAFRSRFSEILRPVLQVSVNLALLFWRC